MGLFDRIKDALTPQFPDPNPAITGTPARGRIVDAGRYSAGGDVEARWNKKQVTLHVVGSAADQLTTVSFFSDEVAHRWAGEGQEVPILLDAHGAVLGIDVAAWEAEVAELIRTGARRGSSAPPVASDARAWEQDAGALDAVDGVDFDTWVAVEAALATGAVPAAEWDARATQLGVPAGRWAAVQSGWQTRIMKDPKLAARFGAAYAAATGQ